MIATFSDLSSAWLTCTSDISRGSHVSLQVWRRSLSVLRAGGMGHPLALWTVRLFERRIRELSQKLNALVDCPEGEAHARKSIESVHTEFQEMCKNLDDLEQQLRSERPSVKRRFLLSSRAILDRGVSPAFQHAIYRLLKKKAEGKPTESLEHLSTLMDKANDSHSLCVQLVNLGFSRSVEDAVSWLVFETIDELVKERTQGQPEAKALPMLREWIDQFVVPWISIVLPHPSISSTLFSSRSESMKMEVDREDEHGRLIQQWRKRLLFYLHTSVGNIRVDQMLSLIDLFPKSLPALDDLKECIRSTDLKPVVTAALREQFTKKMLNAGTMTSDILKQYVNMIRALRFLDPSDVILESVSYSVHEYLRRRPDTVRCIVSDMTGDGDLYQELERNRVKRTGNGSPDTEQMQFLSRTVWEQDQDDLLSVDGDLDGNLQFDAETYNTWEPEAIDAPSRDGKWRSGGDAITTLVAIYGSSEQIVNEYKGLLADKLSTHLEVDIQRETRVLQLLTERFGRETMHDCDIMLKDFADSVQIECALSTEVRNQLESFEATVISKEFWPKLMDEPKFKAMPELERRMTMFEDSYKKIKMPRTLNWQRSLGAVALKLEFDDGRSVEVTVSPIQATILYHFGMNKRLSLKQLQAKLQAEDENFIRRKLQALVNQGFLRAVDSMNSVFETVEHGADADVLASAVEEEEDDTGTGEVEDGGGEEAEMMVFETFVLAMLKNLKQLPLEQIHSMLQRFVQTPKYDKTEAQLAALLAKLLADGKVELSAGLYRLKREPES